MRSQLEFVLCLSSCRSELRKGQVGVGNSLSEHDPGLPVASADFMPRPGQTCAKCGIRTDKKSHSRGLSKGLRTLAEQAGLLGFPTADLRQLPERAQQLACQSAEGWPDRHCNRP